MTPGVSSNFPCKPLSIPYRNRSLTRSERIGTLGRQGIAQASQLTGFKTGTASGAQSCCVVMCKGWKYCTEGLAHLVMQEEVPEEVQSGFAVAVHQLIHQPRGQAGQVALAGLERCERALQVLHLQAPLGGWEEPLLHQATLPCKHATLPFRPAGKLGSSAVIMRISQ